MKRIELRETSAIYSTALDDLLKSDEPVVIEREGHPIGAFMPLELYRHFLAWWDFAKWREQELASLETDRAAYLAMRDELLRTHRGEHVCFREGKLVGIDRDEQKLHDQVSKQFGRGPIYLHKVEDPEPIYHIRSPRIVR